MRTQHRKSKDRKHDDSLVLTAENNVVSDEVLIQLSLHTC